MKTLETLRSEFQTLKASKVPQAGASYNAFAKKWKSLQSQIRNYNNSTNMMKRDGLKVSKSSIGYVVTFKGITAEVFLDGCVVDYWNVQITKGDLDLYFIEHETKAEAIFHLYNEINSK